MFFLVSEFAACGVLDVVCVGTSGDVHYISPKTKRIMCGSV